MAALTGKIEKTEKTSLALLLAGAFLLRLFLLAATAKYPYDAACFYSWAVNMAKVGAGEFYQSVSFADYPPGALLTLLPVGALLRGLHIQAETKAAALMLGLLPALADVGLAALIWRIARPKMAAQLAFRLAALAAFAPGLWYCSSVWGQVDSLFLLPLTACFWLMEEGYYLPAAALYGTALAIKPQALLLAPVMAVCYLLHYKKELVKIPLGALLALLPPVLCGLPFYGAGVLPGLWERYFTTAESYPYATINGFNWMAALGGNWAGQGETLLLLSWQQWGILAILLLTAGLCLLAVKADKAGRFSPLLLAALYAVGVFTFSHRMHERYLLPGAVLTLAAAANRKEKRLTLCAAGLNLLALLNMAAVYSLAKTEDEWLTSATSSLFGRICGLGETILCVYLFYVGCKLVFTGKFRPLVAAASRERATPDWTRREALLLAAFTAVVAVFSFAGLGDTAAPETTLTGSHAETVTVEGEPETLWVYTGIQQGGWLTVNEAELELRPGDCFKWTALEITPASQYTITLTEGSVIELAFKDKDGQLLAVTQPAPTPLFDEQTLVPDSISYRNSFYFDEIYHARTGYEELRGLRVYETTHPPLGKDFIMLGIAIFGMNAFGWRFFGTLFGVLLVPVMYLFLRRLTAHREVSAFGTLLVGLDFMRLAQSRLATIDSYVVFFILLSAWLMLEYCHKMELEGVHRALLPLFLSGLSFGLACASKWTGLYAGAGLAVLFFAALIRRWQLEPRTRDGEVLLAFAGGVLFFVLVPLGVYLASYLPYLNQPGGFSLGQWWAAQQSMFRYHSGLNATHPYASNWYTWLLDLRPVWYYHNGWLPAGQTGTIAGFFSPVVAWGGLFGLLCLGARGLAKGFDRPGATVLVLYLAQLLPWMLVTRCTFLYHYWASALFGVAALCLALSGMKQSTARRVMVLLSAAALVLLACWYPVLTGLPVSSAWVKALRILPSWVF